MASTLAPPWTDERHRSTQPGRALFSDAEWQALSVALRLSPREAQIVQAVFDDMTEAQIGFELGISSHTVRTYLDRLYRKLHVRSRCELLVRVFWQYHIG